MNNKKIVQFQISSDILFALDQDGILWGINWKDAAYLKGNSNNWFQIPRLPQDDIKNEPLTKT